MQHHHPGRLAASDFTHMEELGVTIQGQSFPHLIHHFVLTYSNWDAGTICFSESFESLSEGFQNDLWELGKVPARHRTDRLSTAVNNSLRPAEFTVRYEGLMRYYGLEAERIQAGHGNENGDIEQRHHRFKRVVDVRFLVNLMGRRTVKLDLAFYLHLTKFVADARTGGLRSQIGAMIYRRPE